MQEEHGPLRAMSRVGQCLEERLSQLQSITDRRIAKERWQWSHPITVGKVLPSLLVILSVSLL